MNYNEKIENLASILLDESSLKHKHTIIIGCNAVGKSDIILNILNSEQKNIYFLDSVNRKFNVKSIMNVEWDDISVEEIVKNRVRSEIFNQQDSFGGASRRIETISYGYRERLKELVDEYLGIDFKIGSLKSEYGDEYIVSINEDVIDDSQQRLSDGYQAVIRMFLEILFFQEASSSEAGCVLIDEIDIYLSANYKASILDFMQNKFPNLTFIVTSHSREVLLGTSQANILALGQHNYEIYDSNDVDSTFMVDNIFKRADMLNREERMDAIQNTLRILLNHKIYGIWSENDEKEISEIDTELLSPMNQYIYETIHRWNNE